MTKILLTGGSGFIAGHILKQLLQSGHSVVTTVRSEEKAKRVLESHSSDQNLQVVIVPDVAEDHAFDNVAKTPGLEVVMHTASPFHFKWKDPQRELVDPAVQGTLGLLRSVRELAPSVIRVIVTSSIAAIIDYSQLGGTFTEASWNPVKMDSLHKSAAAAYWLSKTTAEQAAWDFVQEGVTFDLVTVCPPLVLGPVIRLHSLENINTSNSRLIPLLSGKWKHEIPPTGAITLWADVRDVALAHIKAMENNVSGKRLLPIAGQFSYREISRIVRDGFPELAEKLPASTVPGGAGPGEGEGYQFNTDETNAILNIQWRSLNECIIDLVQSIMGHL